MPGCPVTSTAGKPEPGSVSWVAWAPLQSGRVQPAVAAAPSSVLAAVTASPVSAGTVSTGVAGPRFCLFCGKRACCPRPLRVARRMEAAPIPSSFPHPQPAGRARGAELEGPRAGRRRAAPTGCVRGPGKGSAGPCPPLRSCSDAGARTLSHAPLRAAPSVHSSGCRRHRVLRGLRDPILWGLRHRVLRGLAFG